MNLPRYERIGHEYARTRREDPDIRERIARALGDARTLVNVGAGTGSYEPLDRHVVAIEPSDTMAKQRPRNLAPRFERPREIFRCATGPWMRR